MSDEGLGTLAAESEHDRKTRIRSIRITQIMSFIFALGFSSVITGIYPYLQELYPKWGEVELQHKYQILVAVNPIASFISAPLGGYLSSKLGRARPLLVAALVVLVASNILYSTVSVTTQQYRYPLLLVARIATGISSGIVFTLVRSYIAEATYVSERTREVSLIQASQALGFTVGPAIQAALTPIGCSAEAKSGGTFLSLDTYTTCGWLTALLGLLCLVMMLPTIFIEHNVSGRGEGGASDSTSSQDEGSSGAGASGKGLDYVALAGLLINLCLFASLFVLMETLGTPICMDNFGWTLEQTVKYFGILMACNGIFSVGIFFTIGYFSKRFDERKLLLFVGIIGYMVAIFIFFPIPGNPLPMMAKNQTRNHHLLSGIPNVPCDKDFKEPGCALEWCKYTPAIQIWQLILAWALADIAGAYAPVIATSLYSKALGQRKQGLWMGILASVNSLARGIGPVTTGLIYTKYGSYATYGTCIASLAVALVVTLAVYKRLLPPPLPEVTSTDTTINPLQQRGDLNNISGYDNDSFTRSIENTRL